MIARLAIPRKDRAMTPDTMHVMTVAGAFLLLGVAGSPLAWAALHFRKTRVEQDWERRHAELTRRIRSLEAELERVEAARPATIAREPTESPQRNRPSPLRPHLAARTTSLEPGSSEPPLIAVPRLEASPGDRDAAISGLTERYAAIWALADNGAKPDVIARATGQPIGQIELILGLRRQIDSSRTTISHAAHRST
jgi:hypothetical protein